MKRLLMVLLMVWAMQACDTLEAVLQFFNGLQDWQTEKAKIVVINSQRSFFGVLSTPYYVFYPKTK